MRFCHVTTFYPPYHFGGDAILVQAMCEALARRGHRVDVVYCMDAYRTMGGSEPESSESDNSPNRSTVRRHPLRSSFGWLSPFITQQTGRPGPKKSMLREILAHNYDVVNFHNISLVGGPDVLALSQAPVTIYTTHEHWLICPTHVLWKNRRRPCDRPQCLRCSVISGIPPQLWRYGGLIARSLQNVDAILAPGCFTAGKHRQGGVTRPIEIIRPFASIDSEPTEPSIGPDQPTFLYAGRLVRSKGIEHLLEALSLRPEFRLLVAGDGPLAGKLRRDYSSQTNIEFLGPVPHTQMAALYRMVTALVFPSVGPEVFPLSILEAMSVCTPVVVRRAGGSAESVELTGGGWIYETADELLSILDRIVGDPQVRLSRSMKARLGIDKYFNEDRWVSDYLRLIGSIRDPSVRVASTD